MKRKVYEIKPHSSKKEASQANLNTSAADAEGKYTETLQNMQKHSNPGFRKGKAPLSVLENKYGESLKAKLQQKY